MTHGVRLFRLVLLLGICLKLASTAASAQVAIGDVNACLTEKVETSQPATICIDKAHADCTSVDADTPAVATLCFVKAEKAWGTAISEVMGRISDTATDDVAAIAAIEVKYDLLSALLQCDRMEELRLVVGKRSEEDILRENAQCKARATALTYARLYLRARRELTNQRTSHDRRTRPPEDPA